MKSYESMPVKVENHEQEAPKAEVRPPSKVTSTSTSVQGDADTLLTKREC